MRDWNRFHAGWFRTPLELNNRRISGGTRRFGPPYLTSAHIASFLVLIMGTAPLCAQVLEPEALQRKQEDQQRARNLTRELVGGVLDVQLRQLEENGLSDQEIFRDIQLMRRNLNHLVETEMAKIVELLADAQRLPLDQREAAFVEARQQIRTVVRQLAIERQNLMKRLKIAELAEQVRRLMRHQSIVQTATKALPAEAAARRDALTLKAIEDQRDVKELFLHLVDTMVEMKTSSGVLAMASADGLRILKTTEVGKHLDGAGRQLQEVHYELAVKEQTLVDHGLRELLKIIERIQGALNSDSLGAIDRVRIIAERQKQLRDETKSLGENQQPTAEFVERQSVIQKEIAKLADGLRENSKADAHVQQAETAATNAAAGLLEGNLEQAQSDQNRVLGNLAALELALKDQAKQQSRDKSANELADGIKILVEAKSAMLEARTKQSQATAKAEQNVQSALPELKEIAEITKRTMDELNLPAEVETALTEVTTKASEAATIVESASPEKLSAIEVSSLNKISRAINRSLATIEATILDLQRKESAVRIGELARAAEVLERAASEERSIAKDADSLADAGDADRADAMQLAKELADRQQDIKAISAKISEALRETAPTASKTADNAAAKAVQSGKELTSITEQSALNIQDTAKQAAQTAKEASQKLAEAAREIRDEISATANQLVNRTASQVERLNDARVAVEQAIDHKSPLNKVTQLEAAKHRLGQALREQAKAQGKPEAAVSLELADRISDTLGLQESANAAANDLESSRGSELKATTKQEEVAEKAQAALESAAKRQQAVEAKSKGQNDALVQMLKDAHQAAAQAAKQTLDGNLPAADEARKATQTSLKHALALAEAEANSSLASRATNSLDKPAQSRAADAARNSKSLAEKASTTAGADVAPAAIATDLAEKALLAESEQASATQAQALKAVMDAGKKLDAAIQKATAEQAKNLEQRATEHESLAEEVARIDPAAAAAIDTAAMAAKAGSETPQSTPLLTASMNTAELALEQAVADLGAKEQEVRRDRAIAESVANLAKGQQAAAEMIADHASQLEQLSGQPDDDRDAMTQRQEIAEKLTDAQQQFADGQRATGQGAVELSGQREVANQPLRDALEMASRLPTQELAGQMPTAADSPDGLVSEDQQQVAEDQSASNNEPATAEGDRVSETSSPDGPAAKQKGTKGQQNGQKPNALGTGFMPNSPHLTAEMMAGAKAQRAAQKALGQAMPLPQRDSKAKPSPSGQISQATDEQPTQGEAADSSKMTKKEGSATLNQKVKDGPLDKQQEGTDAAGKTSAKSREKEDGVVAKQFKEEAWFAKLPPELRKSIRAGAAQKPPRAYEERLKKYFQSVD